MKSPFKLFFLFVALLLPGFAFAGLISPPGGLTDWDLYVYGNGRVIFDIINSVKMLINPDAGSSTFRSLLLLLATIGFVVLAVGAGFDPGKNFMKMFSYIFVVWFVSYGTTGLTANVVIQDQSRGAGMFDTAPIYRVEGAPALVVLPAVLTSLVGKYFTDAMETYFSIPGELKISGGAVGQYNLFGRMMQESSQYVITSPELKRSISQYVGDCAIPALAMGRLSGNVPVPPTPTTPAGSVTKAYGTTALLRSVNLWETLGTAANKSILTKYYPFKADDTTWTGLVGGEISDLLPISATANQTYMSTGVLVSCDSAYKVLTTDMTVNAKLLLDEASSAWSRAGVMVPFQTAMQTMLAEAGAVGTAGQPSGYIMQTAMINTMSGSFRQAAAQTGNNAMMTSVQLAQAEQSQWSSWSAGFSTFNNMMGYVFTVLQAFIFALTPLVLVSLVIPSMGSKIFVNYAQILVWLTLWMPMLAIINFLITLYGTDSVSMVVSTEGGPSMANKAILAQAVNHQMLAAQFLGGMVPMIAWGLVKGGMAFTEFINAGIGNQFAAAAGAGAATGNLSLNNASMDNTSMNKFSTQASSQVGFQGVSTGANAGSMQLSHGLGGQDTKMNNSAVGNKEQLQNSLQQGINESKGVSDALSSMQTESLSVSQLVSRAAGVGVSKAEQVAAATAITQMATNQLAASGGTSTDASGVIAWAKAQTEGNTGTRSDGINGSAGLTTPFGGVTTKVGTDNTNSAGLANNATVGGNSAIGVKAGTSASTGEMNSQAVTDTISRMMGRSNESSTRASSDTGHAFQEAVSQSLAKQQSITETLTDAKSVTSTMDFSNGVGYQDVQSMKSAISDMKSMGSAEAMRERMGGVLSGLGAQTDAFSAKAGVTQNSLTNTLNSLGGMAGSGPDASAVTAAAQRFNEKHAGAGQQVRDLDQKAQEKSTGVVQASRQITADSEKLRANTGFGAAKEGAKAVGKGGGDGGVDMSSAM